MFRVPNPDGTHERVSFGRWLTSTQAERDQWVNARRAAHGLPPLAVARADRRARRATIGVAVALGASPRLRHAATSYLIARRLTRGRW